MVDTGRSISRREFAERCVNAAYGVTAPASGFSCRSLAQSSSIGEGLRRDLTGLGGTLIFDDASRQEAGDDFGHVVHSNPLAVLRPGSPGDVVAVVNYANRQGLRVAMNGNGHSVYGQAQARNGLVIQSSGLKRIHSIGAEGAHVDAGVTWGELAKTTLASGLTPPVMTEFQDLSIGGTLSVGGVGPASHRFGAQVDHVLELEVVTGSGEQVTCSRDRKNELFYAVLAGFGQCGLIVRARVGLLPAPTSVVVQELLYSDLGTYLAEASRALRSESFDHQMGHVVFEDSSRSTFKLKIGRFYSGSPIPDFRAATKELRFEKASEPLIHTYWGYLNPRAAVARPGPRWRLPHATFYCFFPAAETERFLTQVLATPSEYAGARDPTLFGVSPWSATHFACPLFQVP